MQTVLEKDFMMLICLLNKLRDINVLLEAELYKTLFTVSISLYWIRCFIKLRKSDSPEQ